MFSSACHHFESRRVLGRSSRFLPLAAALLGATALASPAFAQVRTWTSNTSGDPWSTAANWTGTDVPDSAGETADFNSATGGLGPTITLDTSETVGGLSLSGGTVDYEIDASGGATLTFGGSSPGVSVVSGRILSTSAPISSASTITKSGDGTWRVFDQLDGSVLVSDGTLDLGYGFLSGDGSVTGNVDVASGTTLSTQMPGVPIGVSYTIGGLSGAGHVVVNGFTTLAVGNGNNLDSTFDGDISGGGALTKDGAGTLVLNGPVTMTGATNVNAGTLVVNSSTYASMISVNSGSTLGGNGTLASLISTGGIIAPGNSVGTLTTSSATFDVASTFAVEVDGATSDKLVVTSTADFNGATVSVSAPNNNAQATTYRIVDASAGTINSQFNPVVQEGLVAFDAALTQTANAVDLVLTRNSSVFQGSGQTGNQSATAGAIDALGIGNAVNTAVANTYTGDNSIFDQLSGEGFASEKTALAQQSGTIRNAALDRLEQTFSAVGDTGGTVSGYAVASLASPDPASNMGMWGALHGRIGAINATANTAAVNTRGGGIVIGVDGLVSDWRVGAMLHAGRSSASEPGRNASQNSTDFGAGVYGGTDISGLRLSFGADYEGHAISSTRTVAIPGFAQALTAAYGGSTTQGFAEVSKALDLGQVTLAPFANLAAVSVATDAFTETGGPAALSSAASRSTFVFTTLGARGSLKTALADGTLAEVHAGIGWRHTFGATPTASNSFAGGGAFTVTGAPLARDAVSLEAGLGFDMSSGLDVRLDYDGEIAATGQAHAGKITIGGKF
jgi:autotransporter-associated beta strand protein